MTDTDPGLLAIDHVGLAVPDLDAAVAFYTGTLGLTVLHREANPDQDIVEAMLDSPGGSGAAGSSQVQLVAPGSSDSVIARFLDRSGPGLHHLAFRVADVEQAAMSLRQRGCRLLYDSARPGTRGSRINFVLPADAGGVLIELVEVAGAAR